MLAYKEKRPVPVRVPRGPGGPGENMDPAAFAQADLPGKMGVDALAQGDLIRFAPGAYRPDTGEGERLLGHELGHLVRQRRMGPGLAGLPIDGPVSERVADSLAAAAVSRMSDELLLTANAQQYTEGFWNEEQNPLLDHSDFYPDYLMPRSAYSRLSALNPGDLNPQEIAALRGMAGNRDCYNALTTSYYNDQQIGHRRPSITRKAWTRCGTCRRSRRS